MAILGLRSRPVTGLPPPTAIEKSRLLRPIRSWEVTRQPGGRRETNHTTHRLPDHEAPSAGKWDGSGPNFPILGARSAGAAVRKPKAKHNPGKTDPRRRIRARNQAATRVHDGRRRPDRA